MKKAKSGRKNRSVICKKSHAQICAAWLREIDAPLLTSWRLCANVPHVLAVWCACRHASPVSTVHPGSVQPRRRRLSLAICLRKRDGFLGDLGLVRSGLGLALADQAEELP